MADASDFGFFLYKDGIDSPIAKWVTTTDDVSFVENIQLVSQALYQAPAMLATASAAVAGTGSGYLYDFYYRIWVIPGTLSLVNPRRYSNVPFAIWNAYPTADDNPLNSVQENNTTGLTLDVVTGSSFTPLEYRTVNLQFTQLAPNSVVASYNFVFGRGSGKLNVKGLLSSVLAISPEIPVTETWEWFTDIITSYNGTEQRMALRTAPRRIIDYTVFIVENSEYRSLLYGLWSNAGSSFQIPFFQYASDVLSEIPLGEVLIPLNMPRTDFQIGDNAYLYGREGTQSVRVVAINSDSIQVDTPVSFNLHPGDLAMPSFSCFLPNNTKIAMKGFQQGKLQVIAETVGPPHATHNRPDTLGNLVSFNGLPVLDKTPSSNKEDDFVVDTGGQIIDYKHGISEYITSWKYSKLGGGRQYLVQRVLKPETMDWWRDFTAYCSGRQRAFYMPTWRADLELLKLPKAGEKTLKLKGNFYSQYFYNKGQAFKQVAVLTKFGYLYFNVKDVQPESDGDLIVISPSFPDGIQGSDILQVSFLIRCRLGTDKVVLVHSSLSTMVELSFVSAEQ